ncbi:MAG: 4-hydroxythreonine-4-phosphate dehydrogenase PdxA [Elusimicrobia bacterium]|nr:4-hydroxythreonine-4-phosphate dehydrogenase PdxA [Elusimicrobiota bacterium]
MAITCGDPAGIGPELVAKALASSHLWRWCRPVVIGDERLWKKHRCRVPRQGDSFFHVPIADWRSFTLGHAQPNAGRAALAWVDLAIELALAGHVQGLVTAPVSKAAVASAGIPFAGHTEWLAQRTGVSPVAMLLVGGRIRTALVTRHLPLARLSRAVTSRRVVETGRLFWQALRELFGFRAPQIVVCALNPHGGEEGLLGEEERRVILPAVRRLRRERIPLTGPLPADTAFGLAAEGQADGVLALYHDQALIALKVHARRAVVNVTVGLPFIRTAPGHGTAYDIAGKGIADPSAFIEAIRLAAQLARCTGRSRGGVGKVKPFG